jgi:hypothetical protein
MSAARSARAGRGADDDARMTGCQRTARVFYVAASRPTTSLFPAGV